MTQTFTVSGRAPWNPATQVNLNEVSEPVKIRNISGTTQTIRIGLPGPRTVGAGEVVAVYGHIAPLYTELQPTRWEAVDAPVDAPVEVPPALDPLQQMAVDRAAAEAELAKAQADLAAAEAAEHPEENN